MGSSNIMTLLGMSGVSSLEQNPSSLEVEPEQEVESTTSGLGEVLSTQTSVKLPIEQLSIIRRVWNSGCRGVSDAYKRVKEVIIRAWDRVLLPFRIRAAAVLLKKLEAGSSLLDRFSEVRNTNLKLRERLWALHGVVTRSREILVHSREQQGRLREAVHLMLSIAFESMPSSLITEVYSQLSYITTKITYEDMRLGIARVHEGLPSVVLDPLEDTCRFSSNQDKKQAAFAKILTIKTSELDPDLTQKLLNKKLLDLWNSFDKSTQALTGWDPSMIQHTQ